MALCDSCIFFSKDYDEQRQQYDDTIKEYTQKERHFCPMFLGGIPQNIFYKNGDCKFYEKCDDQKDE